MKLIVEVGELERLFGVEFYLMDEAGKRVDISEHQAAMLADMGVRVWYSRLSADAEPGPSPVFEVEATDTRVQVPAQNPGIAQNSATPQAAAPVELIEFAWVKSSRGLIGCRMGPDAATVQLLKDLLAYGDWVRREPGEKSDRRTAQGDFRWPQLVDTGGTPARALAVFFDKHLPAGSGWIALTGEVADFVAPWLQALPLEVIELPALQGRMGDASVKKQLWQKLRKPG